MSAASSRSAAYGVQPQVGVAGYRIDLGVLDDDVPGRFVCGIECDGVAYHSMETARDRDRLRQQVLEARGWTIHRVWSTDWFKDRQGQIERLLRLIAESRQRVKSEAAEAAPEGFIRAQPVEASESVPAQDQAPARPGYVRPVVPQYEMYSGADAPIGGDLLQTIVNALAEMVARVVHLEGPVHEADLISASAASGERKRVLAFRRQSGPLPAWPAGNHSPKTRSVLLAARLGKRARCGLAPRPEFQVTELPPRSSWRRSNWCSPAGMHFNGRV